MKWNVFAMVAVIFGTLLLTADSASAQCGRYYGRSPRYYAPVARYCPPPVAYYAPPVVGYVAPRPRYYASAAYGPAYAGGYAYRPVARVCAPRVVYTRPAYGYRQPYYGRQCHPYRGYYR